MGAAWGNVAGAERRLNLYTYLTVRERRTHFLIMRVFTSTLLADLSAAEVAEALTALQRDGGGEGDEVTVESVLSHIRQLLEWGNLVPGRRETNARSIVEFAQGRQRYQVSKFAVRVQREAEELLRIPEGAREVTRELLPAILRGLEQVNELISKTVVEEMRKGPDATSTRRLREQLSEVVTTLFLQQGHLSDTVRDFYAYVGQVVARHDLDRDEIAGLRSLLVEYIQLVVEDVLRQTPAIEQALGALLRGGALDELIRLLTPAAALGDSVERSRGRTVEDWHGLAGWFVDGAGRPSQVYALREATARAISALFFNVKRSTGGSVVSPGRKSALLRLAADFSTATDTEAHALFDQQFRLFPPRHWLDIVDVDETPPATAWRDGAVLPVKVLTSTKSDRSASSRASRVIEDPLEEQWILAEADEEAKALEATHAELRAAADRLADVTLSAGALNVLYNLIRGAMGNREDAESVGEYVHANSGLAVSIGPRRGATVQLKATHGTLTMDDVELQVQVNQATAVRRGAGESS